MSNICRICWGPMHKDRKGWEQMCKECKKKRLPKPYLIPQEDK